MFRKESEDAVNSAFIGNEFLLHCKLISEMPKKLEPVIENFLQSH